MTEQTQEQRLAKTAELLFHAREFLKQAETNLLELRNEIKKKEPKTS